MKIQLWQIIAILFLFFILLLATYSFGYYMGKIDTKIEVVNKLGQIDLSTKEGMKQLEKDWLDWVE